MQEWCRIYSVLLVLKIPECLELLPQKVQTSGESGEGGGGVKGENDIWVNAPVQADLREILGSVPDHCKKSNITIKQGTRMFWFPSAYKSYVYCSLLDVQ